MKFYFKFLVCFLLMFIVLFSLSACGPKFKEVSRKEYEDKFFEFREQFVFDKDFELKQTFKGSKEYSFYENYDCTGDIIGTAVTNGDLKREEFCDFDKEIYKVKVNDNLVANGSVNDKKAIAIAGDKDKPSIRDYHAQKYNDMYYVYDNVAAKTFAKLNTFEDVIGIFGEYFLPQYFSFMDCKYFLANNTFKYTYTNADGSNLVGEMIISNSKITINVSGTKSYNNRIGVTFEDNGFDYFHAKVKWTYEENIVFKFKNVNLDTADFSDLIK